MSRSASDEEVAGASQDDARKFDQLYERYADRIYAYALSRTGSPEAADDIVGETMISALENIQRFDPDRGAFSTWIFTIASRRIADQQRAYHRFWRSVTTRWRSDPPTMDPSEWAERADESARVRGTFKLLSESHREIVALRYVADLPISEIATLLGISEAAVKMRLNRALKNIAGMLDEDNHGS